MSSNNSHPLPPAPGHQQQFPQYPQRTQQPYQQQVRPDPQRPRAKSNFSFHSRKSSGSGGGKLDYTETHEEKESRRLHSKADPSMALKEAEPSAVAAGERSSLAPIRGMTYRDAQGNPIVEPDRSNPTRSRWERPLDTIRSFEAAIDGNYRRQSYMRADSQDASNFSRRTSYYGGTQVSVDERPRYPQGGYYGGARSQSYRPESQFTDRQNGMSRPDSYYNDNGGPSNGYFPNRARYPRTASEPQFNNAQGVYPAPGPQHSYETVTTASGSGSSGDQVGYSTDPSSENSSVDRITSLPMKDHGENYGFNGFGNTQQHLTPNFQQYSLNGSNRTPRQGGNYQGQGPPPPPPHKDTNPPRVPVKLGKLNSNEQRPAPAEKRKSWFGKRFSKA